MIARHQVELIVAAAGEPVIEHVCVQPLAPPALEGHFRKRGRGRHPHDRGDQREKDEGLVQQTAAITLVEGIERHAVPDVQPILQNEIHEGDGDDHERQ